MTIAVKNLSKSFNQLKALDQVDFTIEEKLIYGLLGRNGAGKSTLLNIISNRLKADEGQVLVDGEEAWENEKAQRKIFLMSEKSLYPEAMNGKKAFYWTSRFYKDFDMAYANKLADSFKLDLKKKIASLSTGYQSILKLIIGLSVNTPYVFFDEPVLGLDANHRELFYKKLIEKYSDKPFTVIVSTHLIEEISQLLEEVIIIDKGKIIKKETCEALIAGGYTVSGPEKKVDELVAGLNQIGVDRLGGLKTVTIMGKADFTEVPEGIEIGKLDLQKLFIKLTGGEEA